MSKESPENIKVTNARVHNLKDLSVEIPRDKLVVITGLSGSGKSSLAFDTIFAEGQRRYVESLSPYARQFLGQMEKPDVDEITGLSPAISIDQKAHSHNPRSTVATITEIYDYMRVLYARIGTPFCPQCGRKIEKMSVDEMYDTVMRNAKDHKAEFVTILAPVVRGRKGEYFQLLQDLFNQGFIEARIDEEYYSLHEKIELKRYNVHDIDVLIDRVMLDDKMRMMEGLELALQKGDGLVTVLYEQEKAKGQRSTIEEQMLSSHWSCPVDGFSFPEIEPRLFSFNSPYGACEACGGIGHEYHNNDKLCESCQGLRLKDEVLAIKIDDHHIAAVTQKTIEDAYTFFIQLEDKLTANEKKIASNILREITARLEFLLEVGIDYITLDRESGTLSGGESQRIRLASQIGSKLSGTLYVLDEPTIGLHERDNERLLNILKDLRDLGNSVVVVEHDEQVIKNADFLLDIGPGPGRHGGEVVIAEKMPDALKAKKGESLTIDYLNDHEEIPVPDKRRKKEKGSIKIKGARSNNIKNLDVEIPLGRLLCITGVSGSGKSTLLENIIYRNVMLRTSGFKDLENIASISNTEYVKKIIEINQSPIGRTPRSNPATYTGIFTPIRDLFAQMPEAQERGYKPGRFSFNVRGGRCEACGGAGVKVIEMHFLPDVEVRCDVCHGKRFNSETLEVKYKGKNIAEVLDMTVEEAHEHFEEIFHIADKLKVLKNVGLDYIKLGQSATTLSGGEAQRIKLSKELARPMARNVMFLLDEPTTGLHYQDVKMLLQVLHKLVEKGNTVLLIEHNMHVIKTVDYIIDMGPEGGEKGGKIVAKGTPEEIVDNKHSTTGKYLKQYLK